MEAQERLPINGPLRIAVIGDPHFVISGHERASTSHLKISPEGEVESAADTNHPWVALTTLIKEQEIRADLLICVGDLTSWGDEDALRFGWQHLLQLGKQLSVECVASATGNHDVMSRSQQHEVSKDIVGKLGENRGVVEALKLLDPTYPLVELDNPNDASAKDRKHCYFGTHFAIFNHDKYRLVVLNSCGEHSSDNIDYQKGSFPESTKKELLCELSKAESNKLNLLICHHPPVTHGHQGENNYDFITNGGELLTALEEHGSWVVFHGHKHHSHLSYGPGGGRSPVIFAAASLGAHLEKIGQGFRNQFYLVELDETLDEDLCGMVHAWDWYQGL